MNADILPQGREWEEEIVNLRYYLFSFSVPKLVGGPAAARYVKCIAQAEKTISFGALSFFSYEFLGLCLQPLKPEAVLLKELLDGSRFAEAVRHPDDFLREGFVLREDLSDDASQPSVYGVVFDAHDAAGFSH